MAVLYETENVSVVDAMVIGGNFEGYRQVACACIASLYEELNHRLVISTICGKAAHECFSA